ncbi:pyruvate kinase [Acuticoccus mangrovi]|uniref:Pyruvate kinase n=1 Tax=Acuticoccus mangrovi TaxID=2796142 RepID=A0A934IHZ9_9HYPH|nr:pyruvate kinase [Acuticoccus mangrovi]MBJ3776823.1 pyruvate kinase [Acuticoccus mangrovi]
MRRARRVRIVATLGPASSEKAQIAALHGAGADVFRINMSHTAHDQMRALVERIRAVETEAGSPITILADLQGPKLRVTTFADDGVTLENGATFVLDSDKSPGTVERVYLPHPEILTALRTGHRLLLDDGKIQLRVTEAAAKRAVTVVEQGGYLSNRKGVSCPDTLIAVGALTAKDRSDLEAVVAAEVDWIALSFIQRPEDLADARKMARGKAGILSKIEKPQAIDRLEEIIELSDALMVARGDLGVEMPLEQVPGLQKRIVRAARRAGKPVVVATQMLESMITSPVPTRAEVSDVATAVFEGADAVMLSAESAAGEFPVEAVATMDRVAQAVERDLNYRSVVTAQRFEPEATGADALAVAARQIAETLNVKIIACYTTSGSTALRVARERPFAEVLALCPEIKTARRLGITWGIDPIVAERASDVDEFIAAAGAVAVDYGIARTGDRLVAVAGVPLHTPGVTNVLQLAFVRSSDER